METGTAFRQFIQIALSFLYHSIFTGDSSHCPYFTCSLKIPQGCILISLLLAKELFRRASITGKHLPSKPFSCPPASPLLGAARGVELCKSSLRCLPASPPLQGTESSCSAAILRSLSAQALLVMELHSFSLSVYKNPNVVSKLRKRKGKWKKKSCLHLLSGLAQL